MKKFNVMGQFMFYVFLKFEASKLVIRWKIIIVASVFVLLALLCWDGISDYNLILENKEPFQKMEREKVSLHIHYTYYGASGVRLLFVPAPISILFNDSVVFNNLGAHINTGEGLFISNSFKGKDLFFDSGGHMDFSGGILLIGAFLGLLYGYDGTRNREYIKLLGTMTGARNPIFFIILARTVLLSSVFLILSGFSLVLLLLSGIPAANIYYFVFTLVLILVVDFFVLLGAVISYIKKKNVRLISLPAIYFLLIFLLPWGAQKIVYIEARKGIESIYEFEYETFKYVMDLEKDFYKKVGVWKSGGVAPDKIKAMIENSRESVYGKLRKKEYERLDEISKRIEAYQIISSFFPTTFYKSLNKELSSKGFQSFIDFYRYAYDMKFNFVDFYIERKFYRALPKSGVEPFIKGNEDLFKGESHLPGNFGLGLAVIVIWLGGLTVLTWFLYDRPQYHRDITLDKDADIDPQPNKTTVVITIDHIRCTNFLAQLRLKGNRFLEVPGWDSLQGKIKVKWFFQRYNLSIPERLQPMAGKYLQDLNPDQKAMIITEITRTHDVDTYIFNNFLLGLSDQFGNYFLDFLKTLKKNKKVVYFSSSLAVSAKIADEVVRFTNDSPF